MGHLKSFFIITIVVGKELFRFNKFLITVFLACLNALNYKKKAAVSGNFLMINPVLSEFFRHPRERCGRTLFLRSGLRGLIRRLPRNVGWRGNTFRRR